MSAKPIAESITLTIALNGPGSIVETIKVEYQGELTPPELARKLGEVLDVEAEELLAVLSHDPACIDHHERHCRVDVTCVDLHFETESKKHRFPALSTWERVHRWACRKFRIAADSCANLELHDGGPQGPVLNEAKPIGHHEGCLNVWLVKPGPEKNGG